MLDRLWKAWTRVAHRIGRFQTVVLISLVYFLVVPWFSLVRLADPLRLRLGRTKRQTSTYWQPRPPSPLELRALRRQG